MKIGIVPLESMALCQFTLAENQPQCLSNVRENQGDYSTDTE